MFSKKDFYNILADRRVSRCEAEQLLTLSCSSCLGCSHLHWLKTSSERKRIITADITILQQPNLLYFHLTILIIYINPERQFLWEKNRKRFWILGIVFETYHLVCFRYNRNIIFYEVIFIKTNYVFEVQESQSRTVYRLTNIFSL